MRILELGNSRFTLHASRLFSRLLPALILLSLAIIALSRWAPAPIATRFQTFTTIFLGIFIEAAPFLVAGSIVSGLIEVYVGQDTLTRYLPRQPLLAALAGSLMGFTFPVCECGVVPVTRRLYQKGLPPAVGVAFLLAAPVINPIVLLSTYAAFGWGPVLIGRFAFTILVAFLVGLIFTLARPEEVLLPETTDDRRPTTDDTEASISQRLVVSGHPVTLSPRYLLIGGSRRSAVVGRLARALAIGGDDFLDMSRYLIIGSLLAAGMQTLVPQSTLLALGGGPVLSVIVLMILAFVLSICSTVDAFVALSFVNSFTTGSILAFLVFGPMVDIKSSLMFLSVFRRRAVAYLILLPLLFTLLISVFVNLNLGW